MKKFFAMLVSVIMVCSLVSSAFAAEATQDVNATYEGEPVQVDNGGVQPNGLYDYAWLVDSVTVTKNDFGPWRVGPTGLGPGTLNINDSTTISRTYTNTISGSYPIGQAAIASTLGISIGVAETHGTSYTTTLEPGERKTIIFRPKTQTRMIITSYYKIPTGIIGGQPEKLKTEVCYVTSFVSWEYSWRYGY